jgi:glycosyltransferase involved in cell wall biosynthesis
MQPVRLSILIPVYNEESIVASVLERVVTAPAAYFADAQITPELIVVDDGSRDASYAALESFAESHSELNMRLVRHPQNRGKGAAIRTALTYATGDFCIIQDADFEYDPAEYPKLLVPLLAGDADLVLGSRFLGGGERRVPYFWNEVANHVLTGLAGWAAGLSFSDTETGYKAFRTALAQNIPLHDERFGLDLELTIKFARRAARIYEVPITYRGRTYEEGKKISGKDAFAALWSILQAWLSADLYADAGASMLAIMSNARRFNRWMADTLVPYVRGDVLEIGAGLGNLTTELYRYSKRYVATDIESEHVKHIQSRMEHRRNFAVAVCDLSSDADFAPFHNAFDSVICLNVLEHIQQDEKGLSNLVSCLRPHGRAVVLVPQGASAFGSLDEVLGHCRRYSKPELTHKMETAGLRVERVIEFNRGSYPGWILNGRILRRRTLSRTQVSLLDWLVPILRRIDGWLPWPANSLIAIGTRGE